MVSQSDEALAAAAARVGREGRAFRIWMPVAVLSGALCLGFAAGSIWPVAGVLAVLFAWSFYRTLVASARLSRDRQLVARAQVMSELDRAPRSGA